MDAKAGEIRSHFLGLGKILAAVFWIICRRLVLDWGNLENRTLQ